VNSAKLQLALERLTPGDWERFEHLASTFLATEFPNLRTLAWRSGDQGRDAVLWQPSGDPTVALQYSVTQYWDQKIRDTVSTLKANSADVSVLVYVTNQEIGPLADPLKESLRKTNRIFLDTRDRRWFVERVNSTPQTTAAAEELSSAVVDPYLAGKGVIETKAQALSSYDAQVALVYLQMQWEDDARDKGLTRLAFDALVRAALRGTGSENRLNRAAVRAAIRNALPAHAASEVDSHTDSALGRLTKVVVRHWKKEDEFCLTFDETQRQIERFATLERQDSELNAVIQATLAVNARRLGIRKLADADGLKAMARRVAETLLLERGEWFATGRLGQQINTAEIERLVTKEIAAGRGDARAKGVVVPLVTRTVEGVLVAPPPALSAHLRAMSDAYTLFAFLRQTPDVQNAIVKMFSSGEIWLDTSVILPLFAEELGELESRQYTKLLLAAREAGSTLLMTRGVLEEVERHFNRALICSGKGTSDWVGKVPFLFSAFMWSGRPRSEFQKWVDKFRGRMRPEDDLAGYLEMEFGIKLGSLEDDAGGATTAMRGAVQEVWREAHGRRHATDTHTLDEITIGRLVDHDVENYLGVIEKRKAIGAEPLGYSVWWLTLDRTAYFAHEELGRRLSGRKPHSPALSPDFMNNYLAVGPSRMLLSKGTEGALPVMMDLSVLEAVPTELIEVADELRQEYRALPEHVIRRRVRDALDAGKMRLGQLAYEGVAGMENRLKSELLQSARSDEQ
jgi:hypothetical protein